MTTGGGAVGGEIFVNIRTEGGAGVPGAGGTPRPAGGGGAAPKDPGMSLLNDKQKDQLEKMRDEKKQLKEYQDFQKLKGKENQNELINELQRARRQATMVAGAVTTGMLARNSKIMSTSMSSLQQIFGAFIDVFLMPFIPLIIPVLTSLAKLLPRFKEWWEKLVSAKGWAGALAEAAHLLKEMIAEWGIAFGEMLGFEREEVEKFYADVGKWAKAVWDGFTAAIGYIQSAWCRGGGTVWGLIQTMASDAWTAIVEYAKGLWDGWAEEHPIMAAKIVSAWCAASSFVSGAWAGAVGYIQETWQASGCNFGTFMLTVATDAGKKIVEGMRWLWGDEGGGFKDKIQGMFVALGDWLESKGLPRMNMPRATVSDRFGPDGALIGHDMDLGTTENTSGWKMRLAGDIAQMFGNPMNLLSPSGLASSFMGSDTMGQVGGGLWGMATGAVQGKWDTGGFARDKYDTLVQKNLSDALTQLHAERGGEPGYNAEAYERQLEIFFSNNTQYGIMPDRVEVKKRGDKLFVDVTIDRNWDGSTFLDGVALNSGG